MESVNFGSENKEESSDDEDVLETKRKQAARDWLKSLRPFEAPKPPGAIEFKASVKEQPPELRSPLPAELLNVKVEEGDDEEEAKAEAAPEAETYTTQAEFDDQFKKMMEAEAPGMDPDFVEAASGDKLGFSIEDIDKLDDPAAGPAPGRPTPASTESYDSAPEAAWPPPPAASPTSKPAGAFGGGGSAAREPESGPSHKVDLGKLVEAAVGLAEVAKIFDLDPYRAVAKLATSMVVEKLSSNDWLKPSPSERLTNLEKQQAALDKRLGHEASQRNLAGTPQTNYEQAPAKPSPEAVPNAVVPEQQIFEDSQGNRVVLQPGWRVERSPGGYAAVLDQHNRVVHYAIPRGAEYWRDQKQESLGMYLPQGAGGSDSAGGVAAGPPPAVSVGGTLAPGQASQGQPSPAGQVDEQPEPEAAKNVIVAAVSNPVLWVAVGVLVLAFFVAALI